MTIVNYWIQTTESDSLVYVFKDKANGSYLVLLLIL